MSLNGVETQFKENKISLIILFNSTKNNPKKKKLTTTTNSQRSNKSRTEFKQQNKSPGKKSLISSELPMLILQQINIRTNLRKRLK